MHGNLPPVFISERPRYPLALEQAWIQRVLRMVGKKRPPYACRLLLPEIAKLSDLLTTDRQPGFDGYAADQRMLLAYGLFFFPQTYIRTAFTLREWITRFAPLADTDRPVRVLDAGAGTGASTFALRDELLRSLGPDRKLRIHAIDQSTKSLRLLSAIHDETRPPGATSLRLTTQGLELPHLRRVSDTPWDLILASYALNELCEERGDDYLATWVHLAMKCLAEEGTLILMEPATQTASLRLQRLRDQLAATDSGVSILAPCLHQKACPLLPLSEKLWCHEVRTWRPPESMYWLNQQLHRDIRVVKWSFLILRKTQAPVPAPASANRLRMVSPWVEQKGRRLLVGCGADGALLHQELLTRHLTADHKQAMKGQERGDLMIWPRGDALKDGVTTRSTEMPQPVFQFAENKVDPIDADGNSTAP
ncbi:MAG: hypothetical protein KDL10_06665 [Kiritimatiellae bacterium]|nr:hypothetical protein [Kiritimatiellia bacterium]